MTVAKLKNIAKKIALCCYMDHRSLPEQIK